jgi:hypothetical protein
MWEVLSSIWRADVGITGVQCLVCLVEDGAGDKGDCRKPRKFMSENIRCIDTEKKIKPLFASWFSL